MSALKTSRHTTHGSQRGDVMILLLLLVTIVSMMLLPFFNSIVKELQVAQTGEEREEALQIAEAGISYYQWHLAHYPVDYQDGTGAGGPYIHSYTDLDTETMLGSYSLSITPPTPGSTIVTIRSTGWTAANPNVKRTITARYGIPSLALYSFLSNDIIWIGSSESVSGQMQSNNGIRFDGTGNAPIMSAKSTYTCPTSQGCSAGPPPTIKNGVWGSASAAVQAFWSFPVPVVDFSSLTSNLAGLKTSAQSGGIYLPPSNKSGYSLVFNVNGTVSVYKVTTTKPDPAGYDVNWNVHNESSDYNARTFQFTQAIPANGIIYAEDNVWVEGTVKGRVMVAAAILPYNANTAPTIYIPNNIVYAARDGTNVLGLLAQNNILVSYGAPNNIEIDGALIAQTGSAQFLCYKAQGGNCSGGVAIKNNITVYGSIMTYGQWTWTWVNGSGTNVSGYTNTSDTYDSNLLYAPPPSFPISSAGYKQLSWYSN